MEKGTSCKNYLKQNVYINPHKVTQRKGIYRRQGKTLYNDKRINPLRRHRNYKCVCTKINFFKKTDKTKRRNRQTHNYSWRLQYSSFSNY